MNLLNKIIIELIHSKCPMSTKEIADTVYCTVAEAEAQLNILAKSKHVVHKNGKWSWSAKENDIEKIIDTIADLVLDSVVTQGKLEKLVADNTTYYAPKHIVERDYKAGKIIRGIINDEEVWVPVNTLTE